MFPAEVFPRDNETIVRLPIVGSNVQWIPREPPFDSSFRCCNQRLHKCLLQLASDNDAGVAVSPSVPRKADNVVDANKRQTLCNSWLTDNRQIRSGDVAVFS